MIGQLQEKLEKSMKKNHWPVYCQGRWKSPKWCRHLMLMNDSKDLQPSHLILCTETLKAPKKKKEQISRESTDNKTHFL